MISTELALEAIQHIPKETNLFLNFNQSIAKEALMTNEEIFDLPRPRSLQELAQEVLQVQDAVNLSGVVHSWSKSITRLRELVMGNPCKSTDEFNRHPINRLWAAKCSALSCVPTLDSFADYETAYAACQQLAKGG